MPGEARGDVLKLQFKATKNVMQRKGKIRLAVDRKYLEYARNCRYPVIFVLIDVDKERAWYLWLQEWILESRSQQHLRSKGSYSIWIDAKQTLTLGLDGELKSIAQWRGPTQLALSILDTFRAALATNETSVLNVLQQLLDKVGPALPDVVLHELIEQAIRLGDRLRVTEAGNTVASQIYALIRRFGQRVDLQTATALVRRGDSYSRMGVNALGVLYDEHHAHAQKLGLVDYFKKIELPELAYFCALREAHPTKKDIDFMFGVPGDFEYAGLRFHYDDNHARTGFHDKYANRGSSAILDYLVQVPPRDLITLGH